MMTRYIWGIRRRASLLITCLYRIFVKRRRPTTFSVYLCASLIILVSTHTLRNAIGLLRETCDPTEAVNSIVSVCKMYHEGSISGTLCSSLCDKDHFQYTDCGTYVTSEKSVLIVHCNGCELEEDVKKVVIKVGINTAKWEQTTKTVLDESDSLDVAEVKLRKIVEEEFVSNFGQYRFNDHDVITTVLGKHLFHYVFDTVTKHSNYSAAIRTLLALALQNEYTKLVGLKDYAFVPKIYGFCGPAFFMEYTPTLLEMGYTLPFHAIGSELYQYDDNTKPWPERARVALAFIQTVKAIDAADNVVEICDLQPENTGINAHNKVVIFDLDHTRYGMEFAGSDCADDEDCREQACQGYCDVTRGKCSKMRVNNNLQAVCQDLFQSHYLMGMKGILMSPPWAVRTELYEALENCINPKDYYNNAQTNKAGKDIAERLEHVLRKSLQ